MKQKFLPILKISITSLVYLFAFLIFVFVFKLHLTVGGWDWSHYFLPATQAFLSGQNPYEVKGFYNPPWIFLVTIPFALLPTPISGIAVGLMNFVITGLLAYRMKARANLAIVAVLSPPIIWGFLMSNIDWVVLMGFLLPPQIGLFFVLLKPQAGFGIALYWFIESWRKGKLVEVIRVFAPVTIAYAFSFLLYNSYLLGGSVLYSKDWNTSLFPYSIIIGVLMFAYSSNKQEPAPAAAATPFISPYVSLSSWQVTVIGLIHYRWLFFITNAILWIYFIYNKIIIR